MNGQKIEGTEYIVNNCNTIFSTVGTTLSKNIQKLPPGLAPSMYSHMGDQLSSSIFLEPVCKNEISNVIKSCKPKCSNDCDDLNMYIIKKIANSIVEPLAHICNLSFSTGVFPSGMKTAKVIPL